MYELFTAQIFTTPIPAAAAMGVGVLGLVTGAVLAVWTIRDELAKARRLMAIDIRYKRAADSTYEKIRALAGSPAAAPTMAPPLSASRVRRLVAEAFERATWRGDRAAEWQDGELRRFIDEPAEPATPYAFPDVEPVRAPPAPPTPVYRNRRDPSKRVPARLRWSPRMAQLLGGPIPLPPLFASIQVPAQRRRPSPLVMANLPADPTRQWRVKVAA